MITNFDTLQTAVLSELKRTGDVSLTAELPGFIQLAEAEIFRELQLRRTETIITGTTSSATIALPVGSAIERVSITANSRDYSLDYTSPNNLRVFSSAGQPARYTVENGIIKLLPAPNGPYTYALYTVPNLAALSASNPTNWVITNAPDVYLFGTVVHAANWTRDAEAVAIYRPQFDRALSSVQRNDLNARLPRSGGLQTKPRGNR